MKRIISCALILAALSSVASMCFAMNGTQQTNDTDLDDISVILPFPNDATETTSSQIPPRPYDATETTSSQISSLGDHAFIGEPSYLSDCSNASVEDNFLSFLHKAQ